MTFKYYDSETGEIIEFIDDIEFTSDMSIGNALDPVVFSQVASDVMVTGENTTGSRALPMLISEVNSISSINSIISPVSES
jgi:hypothetical protein